MQEPFTSYAELTQWYSHARNAAKGRPVCTWGRIILDQGNFHVYAHMTLNSTPFAVIKPDNTVTFNLTGSQVREISHTLTSSVHRVLPFYIQRAAKCRYRAMHYSQYRQYDGTRVRWTAVGKFGYDMYPGLTFDLTSGVCLNPKPADEVLTVDAEQRRIWLRKLREFKRQMKVRARMGVMDSYIDKGKLKTKLYRQVRPDWTHEQWVDVLYDAINEQRYTEQLIEGLAHHALSRVWWNQSVTYKYIAAAIDDTCSIASRDLRLRFGVLLEKQHEQT